MHTNARRGIIVYLVIAFGLAWLPFAPALAGHDPVAIFLMPIAPAIAAVVVRRWVTREGFGDSGLRPRLRQRWPFYLLAALWPIAATLLSVPLALLLGAAPEGFDIPWGIEAPGWTTLLTWVLGSIAIAPIIMGEEIGWRGYLQVRLLADRPWRAAIATGVIWGVWHYPLILTGGENTEDRALTLLLFPIATTSLSVFLGWLRMCTGDIWAGSVAHAANNVTEDSWHRLAFTGQASGVPAMPANVVVVIAEAIVLVGIVAVSSLRRAQRARAVATMSRT